MEEPVRSQARLDQTKRLSNAILRRTVVNVVLFMVIYLVLYGGFVTVFGSTVSNAVYELLDYNYTLHTMLASTFMICSAIGFVRAERTRCEGRRGSQERAGGVSGA